MDFSGFLSVMDVGSVVLAIMAIGAIKFLPGVTRWGISKVINWFQ